MEDLITTSTTNTMKATVNELEGFIKTVKEKAVLSMTFTEFFDWAQTLNYKPFMTKEEFDRLVSVASVEASLENTD